MRREARNALRLGASLMVVALAGVGVLIGIDGWRGLWSVVVKLLLFGWITSDIQGPFKGAPGTLGW